MSFDISSLLFLQASYLGFPASIYLLFTNPPVRVKTITVWATLAFDFTHKHQSW